MDPFSKLKAELVIHNLQAKERRLWNIIKSLAAVIGFYLTLRFVRFLSWRAEMMKRFNGWQPSIFLGNIGRLVEAGGFNELFFDRLHDEHGPIACFFLGPAGLNVSVVDPIIQAQVYRKCISRPKETELFLSYLGKDNLLFTHGPMVKKMRIRYGSMISNVKQLHKLHQVTFNTFEPAIEKWGDKHSVDVFQEIGPLLYDVMGSVLFDTKWSETKDGPTIYRLHKFLIQDSNRWIFYPIKPIWNSDYRKFLSTIEELRQVCSKVLDARERDIKMGLFDDDNSALSLLLTSLDDDGKPFFTRHRAVSSLIGFLNGAYDTTHATVFWLLYNLARNPGSQKKLIEELDAFRAPTVDDLRSCEYLEAVLKESMRIRCTVPVNQRVNLEEDVDIAGVQVPRGTNINIPMFRTFMDPKYFGEETDKFKPERFMGDSPEAVTARKSHTAFGAYSRMCVGFTFALVEVKCLLHTILAKYTIRLKNPSEPGTFMIEAGVNQPDVKFRLVFSKR